MVKFNCFLNEIFISDKVNAALNLDHTNRQWVDLGIHTDICLTQPETCCAAGGAISLWVKRSDQDGEIVSTQFYESSGIGIFYSFYRIGYDL